MPVFSFKLYATLSPTSHSVMTDVVAGRAGVISSFSLFCLPNFNSHDSLFPFFFNHRSPESDVRAVIFLLCSLKTFMGFSWVSWTSSVQSLSCVYFHCYFLFCYFNSYIQQFQASGAWPTILSNMYAIYSTAHWTFSAKLLAGISNSTCSKLTLWFFFSQNHGYSLMCYVSEWVLHSFGCTSQKSWWFFCLLFCSVKYVRIVFHKALK